MFLSKIAASSGVDKSPSGDFWFNPISNLVNGTVRVTPDSALQLSTVYRCVDLKSTSQAMLPFVLYKERSDGSKQRITNHPLYKLFSIRPNPFQNRFEWRQMMNAHIELRGNCYNQIISNARGEITALMPMHPDSVKMELLDNGSHRYRYRDRNGTEIILSRGEVWHLRGLSTDGLMGLSTIALARSSLSGAISAQDFGTRFWANDAKPSGGWIEVPGKFKDDTEQKKFRESLQKAQGGINRGKTMVLEQGMKFHEVTLSNEDAQFLETKKHNVTEIARWFGVPPHKVGDLEKASFSNIEQQALEFVQDCLQPMCVRLEASIEADLLFEDEGIKTEFDLTHLMRGDSTARATYYHNGILDGWLTRNEARIAENYDPKEGLDKPLQPLNMVEAGQEPDADESLMSAEPVKSDTKIRLERSQILASMVADSVKKDAESLENRSQMLASAAAERITRKELELIKANTSTLPDMYVKHAQFVASVLNIELNVAQQYCQSQITDFSAELFDEVIFTANTQTKLERLALKGTL